LFDAAGALLSRTDYEDNRPARASLTERIGMLQAIAKESLHAHRR
jgi:hypothetical protein